MVRLLRNKKNKGLFDPSKKVNTDQRIKRGGRFFKRLGKKKPQYKYCTECGKQNYIDAKKCRACGASLYMLGKKGKLEPPKNDSKMPRVGQIKRVEDLSGKEYGLVTVDTDVHGILQSIGQKLGEYSSLLVKQGDGFYKEVWGIKSSVPAMYDNAELLHVEE